MILGINTTRDISKLSQISLHWRLVKLRITISKYHCGIYAEYRYKSYYYLLYTNKMTAGVQYEILLNDLKLKTFAQNNNITLMIP